jgi:hypothetical protein
MATSNAKAVRSLMGEYYGGSEGGGPPFDLYAYVLKEDTDLSSKMRLGLFDLG